MKQNRFAPLLLIALVAIGVLGSATPALSRRHQAAAQGAKVSRARRHPAQGRHLVRHHRSSPPTAPVNATVLKARRQEQAINRKLAVARAKIAQLKKQTQVHVERLTELQQTVDQTTVQLADSTWRLTKAQHQLVSTKRELEAVQSRFDQEQGLAASRLRAMYKYSTTSHWEALFTAPDLVAFLTRYQYFQHISRQDQKLLGDLAGMMGDIRHKKHRIDNLVTTTEQYTQSIAAQKQTEEQATRQESQLLNQIRTQRDAWEKDQDQLEQSSRDIEEMIRRIMARTPTHPRLGTGRFIFPIAAVGEAITSPFGLRFHPVFHVWRMHTGVDLRAPMRSEIKAADSGVVLFCGWYDGYGKVVILDHGAGLETLYAHLSRWLVTKGERVHQGQEIALSGMTGDATGPHLHFEVRKNGKPVNPLGFLR